MNSLYKKLRFEKFDTITIINKPTNYDLFNDLKVERKLLERQDCIVCFVETLKEIKDMILEVGKHNRINDKGYLYFAYPKLNNPFGLNPIHRDAIFPYLNIDMGGDGFVAETNLKFSRMVKLDDNYTVIGLRQFDKRPKIKETVSQRLDDYVQFIPNLVDELKEDPITLNYFTSMSPYKQKEWARYIYSAKKEDTKQKRWEKLNQDARNN